MPRRKQAAQAIETTPVEAPPPIAPESVAATSAEPARTFRKDPFPIKTADLDGYKLRLLEKRDGGQGWQMQIKFGEGTENDKPSQAVLDYLKSRRAIIETKDGEKKDVQLFHWNRDDASWSMKIDFEKPATSRAKADQVFNEVADIVANERGVSRQHEPSTTERRTPMTTDQKGNKPAHEIRDGALRVSLWQNQNDKGTWYSATCRRSYKDGEVWKETQSYGEEDLLRVAKLFDMAHSWMLSQKQANAAGRKNEHESAAA